MIKELFYSRKWVQFAQWYNKQKFNLPLYSTDGIDYNDLAFDNIHEGFQRGVLTDFVFSCGYYLDNYDKFYVLGFCLDGELDVENNILTQGSFWHIIQYFFNIV